MALLLLATAKSEHIPSQLDQILAAILKDAKHFGKNPHLRSLKRGVDVSLGTWRDSTSSKTSFCYLTSIKTFLLKLKKKASVTC